MSSFHGFELLPSLLATLDELGFDTPTEIQDRTLPLLLKRESVVGVAETGSGKTLAYALPMLQLLKLLEDGGDAVSEVGRPRGLVLVPSSDLGEQVAKAFKLFTHDTRLRVRSAVGGTAMKIARKNVAGPFEILLATPGRLEQLMQLNLVSLSDLRVLVLDEADQILDQGFLPGIKRVLKKSPAEKQMALFTATASDAVQNLIGEMFSDAELIETVGRHRLVSTLVTENLTVPNGKRFPLLEEVLARPIDGGTLIFGNTREQCDKLAGELGENGYSCAIYRGDMDKKERRQNLADFREGTLEILISTELAARGLDVENVDRVINYHLPKEMKNYLHRAGRTARAGRKGTVINFVTDRDQNLIKRLDTIGGG
ncbi:MAG: DEAD/DEAH box helicase [Verrucomicrobiales bacterium]|nr:DEAD/DEAH box helicase [Verrucomicrobiales bacterium]